MTRKQKLDVRYPKTVSDFDKEARLAAQDGLVPIIPTLALGTKYRPGGSSVDAGDPVQQRLEGERARIPSVDAEAACMCGSSAGVLMNGSATLFDYSQNNFGPVDGCGTEGLGYAVWGPLNDLPCAIYSAAAALPFSEAAIDYVERTLFGCGPQVMYCITRYVGGTVTHEEVPYRDAEVYLKANIRRIALKVDETYGGPGVHQYEEELEDAKAALASYRETRDKIDTLLERNNLNYFYKRWIADTVRLGICFPLVGLSRSGAGKWEPDIVNFELRDACVMRLEERDPADEMRINHVYYSERWRDCGARHLAQMEYVAYPCVMPEHATTDLQRIIRANQRTKVSQRPFWICAPNFRPTPTKPYYPQLSWWSIFPSQVYQYASRLIYDKASARRNSTMWGKILFVNVSYLSMIYAQMGEKGKTREGQEEIRTEIYNNVNSFLRDPSNNGKLLLMDSYMSADEKQMIDSVRIVDVPRNDSTVAKAADIAEVASLVSYCFGVNMDLVGSRPWTSSSSTGTAQRELHLLKNGQLSPDRLTFCDFFNGFLFRHNHYDPRFRMVVRYPTLTTLDNSKTGTLEQHDGN